MILVDRLLRQSCGVIVAILACMNAYGSSTNALIQSAGLEKLMFAAAQAETNITSRFVLSDLPGDGWVEAHVARRGYLNRDIGNYSGSHNYFLDVIFQRGVFGEILFVSIITAPFFLIKKRVLSDGEYILLGVCGACYLMFLIEPFFTTEYLIIPIIYLLVASLSKTTIVFKTKK